MNASWHFEAGFNWSNTVTLATADNEWCMESRVANSNRFRTEAKSQIKTSYLMVLTAQACTLCLHRQEVLEYNGHIFHCWLDNFRYWFFYAVLYQHDMSIALFCVGLSLFSMIMSRPRVILLDNPGKGVKIFPNCFSLLCC